MNRILQAMSDPPTRHRMGRNFEVVTDEVFTIIRWAVVVGFARYIARVEQTLAFTLASYALVALLFGYILSRFLLRPELRLFDEPMPVWKRFLQFMANFLLCFVGFLAVMYGIESLSQAVIRMQFVPAPEDVYR